MYLQHNSQSGPFVLHNNPPKGGGNGTPTESSVPTHRIVTTNEESRPFVSSRKTLFWVEKRRVLWERT